jgi:hypothetical protein
VIANGVRINSLAFFSLVGVGNHRLAPGTVFTAISNTAPTPISGTFANLANGSMFTVGNNTFQASYEGGDGNDLTLTVVP